MSTSDEISTDTQEATAEKGTFAPGIFCWWELGTTDADGAKNFYTNVFGWSYKDMPMGPDMVYTTFLYDGKSVGACYKQDEQQISRGIPPNWLSYVHVTSVDESAAKVTSAGGTVLMGAMDVGEHGRMAVVQDPTGAVLGLWQSKQHTGAQLVNTVGGVCWTELISTDAAAAKPFYNALFGWVAEAAPMSDMDYAMFKNGTSTAGGVMQITPDMQGVPSHWMPYVTVDDCDATVAKITENGGQIIVPPMDIPNVGRFSLFRDPQGAHLSCIALAPSSM